MASHTITPQPEVPPFEAFLEAHLGQEMLRFTTAGSVDDGKSTLIGRLLHDTKSVYEDQLAAVASSRVNRASGGHVDFSLLTDGLKAEREQGITIDVAYRYFSTAKRKFIIADTPGHEQYTRNMATGASTADVAIVLIDARAFLRLGTLLPQSRRHTYIASLLGIPHVVAAVNKMDIVDYSHATFQAIEAEFRALAAKLGLPSVQVIPVSALEGDNVVTPSTHMRWYSGPTLLEYLENVPLSTTLSIEAGDAAPLRFPVQLVLRPDLNFRGFAGQVARGVLRPGEAVMALPSRKTSTVKRIVTYDGDLEAAAFPQSVTVELEDEIDLSRGEMLVSAAESAVLPSISNRFKAMVVWMHEDALVVGKTYIAKHTTRTVRATVKAIDFRVDIGTLDHLPAERLVMNEVAEVEFETSLPLFFDAYADSRATGALILIDAISNATVGAAMILGPVEMGEAAPIEALATDKERPVLCLLPGRPQDAQRMQASFVSSGERAIVIDDDAIPDEAVPAVVRALQLAGVIAITARFLNPEIEEVAVEIAGSRVFRLNESGVSGSESH
ncbi:sulfate adenylyltransferase subunit 1 [Granulicella pectinivorans]|jgi:bifunctional enzyme CysN/CysC/sulfate adenylyltransferase subunit 1|uniref:Sulfate adenylyltransferase subunit 1 n=1 Tax=Granulicella pectinivorans TaxID=474950 RepID=A0A1I6M5F6_9BACT|nr:sulfate adenylyltransferase subunit CysN [Granulicella pectinivorans]SFS10926.1 sulfate adenylyltransferase subunit 1 [Granulicella pectinivorans]